MMSEKQTNLRLLWRRWWRRTPLTVKALFFSIFLGTLFWMAMDFWQTRQVVTIFQNYLLDEINTQARRDRTMLDRYFHHREHSVKLLTYMIPLTNHVRAMLAPWANDVTLGKQWHSNSRPPWLPPRSIMHGMAYTPYILLLDAQRHVRESFHQDEALPPLANDFIKHSLPTFLQVDGRNSITAEKDGTIYLITSAALLDVDGKPQAFIALIAPMNDDFLAIFHANAEKNDVVVFINSDDDRVFASSRPYAVASGTKLSNIKNSYIVVGKKFLDYGFSSNVLINFATLIAKEEVKGISNAVLHAERQQRIFGYASLAIIFLAVVFSVAKSLQRFTQKMVDISIEQLEIQPKTIVSGDQLLMMEEQFYAMTDEILQSRQQTDARRMEMQVTNDALNKSLVVIKRTQSKLVESEKMASLGGLVAGVAHEINTPVGIGVTAASFLEERSRECAMRFSEGTLLKPELDSFFRDVVESTDMILSNLLRAAKLIRSFKQVAVDRTNEERRAFFINEYFHQVLLSLHPRMKNTKITVTVQCSETLKIDSYPGVFSQIIFNLVINSLKHGFQEGGSGEIFLQVGVVEGDILFRYSDNGRGMAENICAKVFEPFFTTARGQGGCGLGMHIVFNLVTQTLKGTIKCSSSPGKGATFTMSIPLAVQRRHKENN